MTARIRIPADVERDDRVVAGLTARQLTILVTAGLGGWVLWTTASRLLPAALAAAAAAPPLLAGLVLAVGHRDGLPLDRLLLAAVRWWRRPHRLVPAPDGVPAPPPWAAPADAGRRRPAPLGGPPHGLDPAGPVDLGGYGVALVCRASPVNFRLRTPAEQQQLVAAFARLLDALDAPVQLLVRADRIDLHQQVGPRAHTLVPDGAHAPGRRSTPLGRQARQARSDVHSQRGEMSWWSSNPGIPT